MVSRGELNNRGAPGREISRPDLEGPSQQGTLNGMRSIDPNFARSMARRMTARCVFVSMSCFLAASSLGQEVDFARDIRPIISENCSFCHGPDEETREAGLRLDEADGAWSVLEKGDRSASELYARITSDDPETLMPPPDSNRQLTDREIELIAAWIDQGAPWEQHWSFRPIEAPAVPQIAESPQAPIRNPIDAFVQSLLVDHPLQPSPAADRRTLVRRLSLDLTGLPPTPSTVESFLSDDQPDAYERLVDRILDSPGYGQRMAWDWLDAARYADTNGYQGDRQRTMWPWRDWVVHAFNENLPYDQFTVWQLAGDLLPEATFEQKLATGFCRNHMINGEGGRIAEENRVEYVMDMSETMGTVWLGLTLNCCRCHDHKYDPLTNAEYYQLFAFFNQTPVDGSGGNPQTPPNLAAPTKQQSAALASINAEISAVDRQLNELSRELVEVQPAWESEQQTRLRDETRWHAVSPHKVFARSSRTRVLEDNSVLVAGPPADNDHYTLIAATDLNRVSAIQIEALRHSSLSNHSLSNATSGNFVLTEVEVFKLDRDRDGESDASGEQRVELNSATATFAQKNHDVELAIDGDATTGWAVYEGRVVDREHAAVFRLKNPVNQEPGGMWKIVLRHDSKHKRHNIGRFRISLTDTELPQLSTVSGELLAALSTPIASRSTEQKQRIATAHRESVPQYQSLRNRRDMLLEKRNKVDSQIPKVMVMADRQQPRETFILNRGLYNKPMDPVSPKLPAFLPGNVDQDDADRLTLARWLVDPANPLTARVTVNRFWQQIFGVGLVKTTEDFGTQGETPIQIELLDWLADRFVRDGWDVKNLIRLIVNSHTYRQSSKIADESAYQLDPENRLLSRGARYRLPSWMLRDQALAASGLLSDNSGGPSVNSYQPPGVWEEASFGKMNYERDDGDKLYRRSLYTFWRRIIAPTMFFDSASRQTCTVKSSRTNTPLHALQTMNDVTYVEAARALGEIVLTMPLDSDSHRVDEIMRRVIARPATVAERKILIGGLERTRRQMKARPADAARLLSMGESERDNSLDAAEHAAWTSLCLAVLNLDETLNRE